jgi:RHS repeat-associated protein
MSGRTLYMQQRYYDPIAGRFLSVDPVTTNARNGTFFNRYEYAKNNPYRYTDPDGRCIATRIGAEPGSICGDANYTGSFPTVMTYQQRLNSASNPIRMLWEAAFGPAKVGATQAEVGKALSTAGNVGTAVGLATAQPKVLAVAGAVSLVGAGVEAAAKPDASSALSVGMEAAGAALPPGRFSAGVSLGATAMKEGVAKLPTSDAKPNLSELKIP